MVLSTFISSDNRLLLYHTIRQNVTHGVGDEDIVYNLNELGCNDSGILHVICRV